MGGISATLFSLALIVTIGDGLVEAKEWAILRYQELLQMKQNSGDESLPWLISSADIDALKAEDARRISSGGAAFTPTEYEIERDALLKAANEGIMAAFERLPPFQGKQAWSTVKEERFSPDKLRLYLQKRAAQGVVAAASKVDRDFQGLLSQVDQKVLEAKSRVDISSHEAVESAVPTAFTRFWETFTRVRGLLLVAVAARAQSPFVFYVFIQFGRGHLGYGLAGFNVRIVFCSHFHRNFTFGRARSCTLSPD